MTAKLKAHPAYKDSGLSWLDRVPEHWEVRRNGRLFTQRKETGFADLPVLEVSLRTGVRVRKFDAAARKQMMSDRSKYKRAAKGDIAYNMMRMWQGAVGVAPEDGLVSPAYVVASPLDGMHARYFSELFRTSAYMGEVDAHSHGIVKDRNRLYWEDFKQIFSLYPPPAEQQAIVRFLDHLDRRVGRYIRAKQRLIKLLDEQKQAVVHHAVTHGLNPNVRRKPSGTKWLEDVPEHWEIIRLKYLITSIEQGWSPQCDAQPAGLDEWGVLKVGCVNRDYFDATQNKKLPVTLSPVPALEVCNGDILVSRANTRELLGLATVVQDVRPRLLLCDKLFRFRPRMQRACDQFLVALLRDKSCREQIETSTNGASDSMQNIGQGVIKNLWIAMPPLAEQCQIVEAIEKETSSLTGAAIRARREIELLREYRTSVITDVVTGKLDVREAAANLPDDLEELDEMPLLDEALEEDDGELTSDELPEE